MKFEDVKNVKVGDKLKVIDSILCSNLDYEANRGNIEKDDTIILTVTANDKGGDKPFLCSINVNGKDKGVKWWISYEAVEVIGKQTFKSGDKVVCTGKSVQNLGVINGEKYSPLTFQQSGDHYSKRGIQPVEYGIANNLSFPQANIIKYITRHEDKNGVDDLTKSIHYHFFEALRVYGEDGSDQLRKNVAEMLGLSGV